MRSMEMQEIDCVSGGLDITVDFGVVVFEFTGTEVVDAYDWAVGQMTDFFTWWDPMGYYRC